MASNTENDCTIPKQSIDKNDKVESDKSQSARQNYIDEVGSKLNDNKSKYLRHFNSEMSTQLALFESHKINFKKVCDFFELHFIITDINKTEEERDNILMKFNITKDDYLNLLYISSDNVVTIGRIELAINHTYNKSMTINLSNFEQYTSDKIEIFCKHTLDKMRILVLTFKKLAEFHNTYIISMLDPDQIINII